MKHEPEEDKDTSLNNSLIKIIVNLCSFKQFIQDHAEKQMLMNISSYIKSL